VKKIKYFFVLIVLMVISFLLFCKIKKGSFVGIIFLLVIFWSMIMVFFAYLKEVFNEKNN